MKNSLPFYLVLRLVHNFHWNHFKLILVYFSSFCISSIQAQTPLVNCHVGNCEAAFRNVNTNLCMGHIKLTAEAKDDSTTDDQLIWSYKIDLFNDRKGVYSTYDLQVSEISKTQYKSGQLPLIKDNIYADDSTQAFDASGTYPLGIHSLVWFVKNANGNVGVCSILFEIKDCRAPTPYCLAGIIEVSLPSSGCIDFWAKDLDHGSSDNCSSEGKLKFYFDGDPTKPSIRICCADFLAAGVVRELKVDVEMWVEDEEGNHDFCKTTIVFNDNLDICGIDPSLGKIAGEIKTRKGETTKPVLVQLFEKHILLKETLGGPYVFSDLAYAKTYTIKLNRNDDHLNGVSTLDNILIQKHILGKSPFTDPYTLISADVNNSRSITSADISEIRKLILGVKPEFTKVQSWKFISEKSKFADPSLPWNNSLIDSFSIDTINLSPSNSSMMLDFIAIKMGDVNESARASNIINPQIRQKETLNFCLRDINLEIEKEYKIDFTSSNFINVEGFQFTLKFDQTALEFNGVESGVINIQDENFGLNRLDQGILTSSWNVESDIKTDFSKVLFSIIFKAKKSGCLSHLIQMNSRFTKAEAYSNLDELMDVKLNFLSIRVSYETELLDNLPNPFSEMTNIRFYLNEEDFVRIKLYTITGHLLREYQIIGRKGINLIEIDKKDLNISGIILYQLESNSYTATKKMIFTN